MDVKPVWTALSFDFYHPFTTYRRYLQSSLSFALFVDENSRTPIHISLIINKLLVYPCTVSRHLTLTYLHYLTRTLIIVNLFTKDLTYLTVSGEEEGDTFFFSSYFINFQTLKIFLFGSRIKKHSNKKRYQNELDPESQCKVDFSIRIKEIFYTCLS